MGVPALFRWLSAKYPKIVEQVQEMPDHDEEGRPVPVDLTQPNPNGIEFDNLYLDMNGIIHPCCHPMDKPAPATEQEMMVEIFKYIDRIFAMIRPRRLLFMAIDGVAPRAKMNQQRSRRFRAARERREKAEKEAEIRAELANNTSGIEEPSDSGNVNEEGDENLSVLEGHFDSNCITPGTQFMALVAESIKYYIVDRMNKEPAWQDIKVIFSDANVPGEGEHKIVDYIRRQRLDPDYDPNTRHVIYGLDADLIMLSMATHEPHFRVLREDVFWEEQIKYNPCSWCRTKGHGEESCPKRAEADPSFHIPLVNGKPFIFLDIAVLREYLEAELRPTNDAVIPFRFDLERAIDDWIFMCFFVGNDFLPHLPSLEIREGAVDLLIDIYKANARQLGGYICQNGIVDLRRARVILHELGKVEDRIFIKRKEKEDRREANIKRRKQQDDQKAARAEQEELAAAHRTLGLDIKTAKNVNQNSGEENQGIIQQHREANLAAAEKLREELSGKQSTAIGHKRPATMVEEDEMIEADMIRLWEPGFKDRYYLNKLSFDPVDNVEQLHRMCRHYLEGLCWVMAYYYQGCPSWKWFYPFHYAPLASDLANLTDEELVPVAFELGQPFRPFDQLMSVFPADSRDLVPAPFRSLMTDPTSEIFDFYPEDFAVDLNGKKQAWQGVVLLPFIDEQRLLIALEKHYSELGKDELQRNELGEDLVYFAYRNPAVSTLLTNLDDDVHSTPLNPRLTDGLAGYVKRNKAFPPPGGTYLCPLSVDLGCMPVANISVACFIYFVPYHERTQLKHKTLLLPEAHPPPHILTAEDISAIRSGLASRRVPGRLLVMCNGNVPERYGHHSMHQEHAKEYERRDAGLYAPPPSSTFRGVSRDESQSYYDGPRTYPPPMPQAVAYSGGIYPPPPSSYAHQYPYPPPPKANPFEVLTGRPPGREARQHGLNQFHPPPRHAPAPPMPQQDNVDHLYGGNYTYPPPRNR